MQWSVEMTYMALVAGLFILPRGMQRLRIPGAITALGLGAAVNIGFHAFHADTTIELFGTFGIVALFLFAGLEVAVDDLYRHRKVLLQHIGIQGVLLGVSTGVCHMVFGLDVRPALLFSLALFTPSTGFILDSLPTLKLAPDERYFVKAKAIAAELVALFVLFFTVQSTEMTRLGVSTLVLVALVLGLPVLFRIFDRFIVPFAPGTEFTFLILTALMSAYVTRELGVYYLVGAFVVGLTAVRMRHAIPSLSAERLLIGVELFASFFIPFYFFKSGLHLEAEQFSLEALGIAAGLLLVVVPIRVARVAAHWHWVLKHPWATGARVGTAILPTLVFTIVLAEILRDRFQLAPQLFGALIIFTIVNTVIPGILLRIPPPTIETPTLVPAAQQIVTHR